MSKCCFFGLEMVPGWSGITLQKTSNFQKLLNFWYFLRHISWPNQVFPWSDWAHIKQAPSSNIVLKHCLRISWSVKYFCQKYWVKGSKSCNSAGTPRISRRPVQWWRWGRVLRTMNFLFENHQFLHQNVVFLVQKWFQVHLGSSSKKHQIFKNRQNFDILSDSFRDQSRSFRDPIELILSKLKALIWL